MRSALLIFFIFSIIPWSAESRVFAYGDPIGHVWIQCDDAENPLTLGPITTGVTLDLYMLIFKNQMFGVRLQRSNTDVFISFKDELTQLKISKSGALLVQLITPLRVITLSRCVEKNSY